MLFSTASWAGFSIFNCFGIREAEAETNTAFGARETLSGGLGFMLNLEPFWGTVMVSEKLEGREGVNFVCLESNNGLSKQIKVSLCGIELYPSCTRSVVQFSYVSARRT